MLNNEGVLDKLGSVSAGLETKYGIDYQNQLYNEIDRITKGDILNFAEKIFKNPPTYAIVATQDTLDNNKEFLNSLQ